LVISSVGSRSPTGTEHGLNALPLTWDVQALQTLMPQPYLGPVTPRMSRSTQRSLTSGSTSTVTVSPFSRKVCSATSDLLRKCPSRRWQLLVSASAMPSDRPPIICAFRPVGLITSPASTAITALVTRGPVTAL